VLTEEKVNETGARPELTF